jgi:hypothetical protein
VDHIITEAEARKLLEPYRARLLSCILAGWERWQELLYTSPGHFTTTRATSRANLVYDYIVEAAKREFLPGGQPEPHVRVSEKHGFLTLTFHDQIVIRFKKFRGRGLWPSGIPTRQQQLFAFQLPMENMPAEVTKAVAGYLLNSLQDEIERAAVTCSVGNEREWIIDLEPEAGPEPSTLPAPASTPSPGGEPAEPVVRLRSAQADQGDQVNERKGGV